MILYAFKMPNSDVIVLLVRLLFVEVCDCAPPKNPIIDVVKVLKDGDLQTIGMLDYNKRLQHFFTSHLKVDSVTGEKFTFGCL
ncbi:hypothetical protein P3L10_009605 [Capsicum annuum]